MHLCESAMFYGICYICIRRGVDFKRVLRYFNMKDTDRAEKLGEAGIAFIVYKALMPARLVVTAFTVPIAAKILGIDEEKIPEENLAEEQKQQTPSK